MIYYQAKTDFDHFPSMKNDTSAHLSVIKDELFTRSEMIRLELSFKKFLKVRINKNKTFINFGVRLKYKDAKVEIFD